MELLCPRLQGEFSLLERYGAVRTTLLGLDVMCYLYVLTVFVSLCVQSVHGIFYLKGPQAGWYGHGGVYPSGCGKNSSD